MCCDDQILIEMRSFCGTDRILCVTVVSSSVSIKSKTAEVYRRKITFDYVLFLLVSEQCFVFRLVINSAVGPASIHETRLQQLLQQMHFSEI